MFIVSNFLYGSLAWVSACDGEFALFCVARCLCMCFDEQGNFADSKHFALELPY